MKPANARTLQTGMDCTYTALEAAASLLPAAKIYRLVIHSDMVRWANQIIGLHADVLASNPLSPGIEVVVDEAITDIYEWRLEAGGEIFWSPGG